VQLAGTPPTGIHVGVLVRETILFMKTSSLIKIVSIFSLTGICALGGLISQPTSAEAAQGKTVKVALKCENPGSHQDVAKTPIITNSTRTTLPKGRVLYWQTNKGEKGQVQLVNDLKPLNSVSGLGGPGQVYTCTAYYLAPLNLGPRKPLVVPTQEATHTGKRLLDAPYYSRLLLIKMNKGTWYRRVLVVCYFGTNL
jgi:hypothetical protein